MTKISEMASLMRSKNAGPFTLTIDIMFYEQEKYERVKNSGAISREIVASAYKLPSEKVQFFFCDNAFAIKASLPRPYIQGDLRDADSHQGQQYAPLMDIEI